MVISDVLTTAPALAAEVVGVKRATLVPHIWPEHAPGLPLFGFGLHPARTRVGRWAWKGAERAVEVGLKRGRDELNEVRARLGLAPLTRFHSGTSEELALVATFPQFEYPRKWPEHVRVTGPLLYELPGGDVLPAHGGDGQAGAANGSADDAPMVIVAPSTAKDPECALIRVALEALADEPVRVVATTNRHTPKLPIELPPNATLVGWLSYRQAMPQASLVICHGGHGTIATALSCGVPVLVSPVDGDMTENGARVSWAGCGLMIPGRLTRPSALRRAVRLIRGNAGFTFRAQELSRWAAKNDGPARAAAAIEGLL